MSFPDISVNAIIVSTSWLLSLVLLINVWRSKEALIIKILLIFIGAIPLFGPVLIVWTISVPGKQKSIFKDNSTYSADVYDRWHHIFNEKNPFAKFRKWKELNSECDEKEP